MRINIKFTERQCFYFKRVIACVLGLVVGTSLAQGVRKILPTRESAKPASIYWINPESANTTVTTIPPSADYMVVMGGRAAFYEKGSNFQLAPHQMVPDIE